MTLFCEDFRIENNGKHIFIGAYAGAMTVHTAFPVVLPKFVFAVFYYEVTGAFSDDIKVLIFLPGDPDETPSIQVQISKDQRTQVPLDSSLSPEDQRLSVFAPIIAAPLVLRQTGQIKVRALCGDTTTKLGTLPILQQLPEEPRG